MNKFKTVLLAMLSFGLVTTLSACEGTANDADERATDKQLAQYQKVQPIPFYDWSQHRETLLSVLDAQVKGTATTTFFFNQGVAAPFKVCPSLGYPVPSTTQVTSPDQHEGTNGAVTAQMEPNGTYTGDSSATYVVCIINGKAVPTYWEGFVHAEGGPAKWDAEQQLIVNTGSPSVTVSTK